MKIKSLLSMTAYAVIVFIGSPVFAQSQLTLTQRVDQLEQQAETRNQIQSQMSMQLIELQKEVKELRGIIEEHDYKLKQIQERQRDLYRDIDNRFSGLQQSASQNTINSATTNTTKPSTTSTTNQAVNVGDDRSEFEAAFDLVRNKQYSEAIKGFEAFLKKYPKGSYSDNARFWIGQVYYAQSDFAKAEEQFVKLKTEFPNSTKLSAAMIKIAEIKQKQQKWSEAKTIYNEVIAKFTGSPQQLARKGLEDIKKLGH